MPDLGVTLTQVGQQWCFCIHNLLAKVTQTYSKELAARLLSSLWCFTTASFLPCVTCVKPWLVDTCKVHSTKGQELQVYLRLQHTLQRSLFITIHQTSSNEFLMENQVNISRAFSDMPQLYELLGENEVACREAGDLLFTSEENPNRCLLCCRM